MDQPRPDRPTPEDRDTPGPIRTAIVLPPSKRDERVEWRLRLLVGVTTPIIVWTRGWVSRELPAHRLLAARTLDYAVLTDRHLILFSAGFFSRHPRRLVYSSPLDEVRVRDFDVPVGRRLSISGPQVHRLRLELSEAARPTAFANALIARTRPKRS